MGENQSSFNSLLSILWQPTATFFPRVTVKLLIAGMLKLIKVRTVGSPTGGSAVEESFPEARAQTIHHCPSAKLYKRENELKTLMEAQGRIQGFHKKTDKKAGGESEARLPVDEEWTKISTVSPLPLSFPLVLTSKKQSKRFPNERGRIIAEIFLLGSQRILISC